MQSRVANLDPGKEEKKAGMKYAIFLIVLATLPLAACGKSENAPAMDLPPGGPQSVSLAPDPERPAALVRVSGAPAIPTNIQAVPPAAAKPFADSKPAQAPASPAETPSAVASQDLAHGQQIFGQACAYCHDRGVAGAPKIGDAAAWNPRLAQGMDTLYAVALRGKGAMPPKGGNPALTDSSVRAAVDYLVARSR